MRPVLFTVPGVDWDIQAYGLFIGLALIVGWILSLSFARRDNLPVDILGTNYVLTVAFGLFGARAAWLLQHGQLGRPADLLALQAGAMAPFAGVAVGLLVGAIHLGRRRIPPLLWWDAAAPAFAVGVVCERLGGLLAGAGYGRYAPDLALAIRYPQGSPPYEAHARTLAELLPAGAELSLPVHPTPIYGALLGIGGVALCLWLRRRRSFVGQIFLGYVIYLLAVRSFIEEPFRADAATPVFGPLNPGQIAAAVLIVALVAVYRVRRRRAAGGGERPLWEGGPWSEARTER